MIFQPHNLGYPSSSSVVGTPSSSVMTHPYFPSHPHNHNNNHIGNNMMLTDLHHAHHHAAAAAAAYGATPSAMSAGYEGGHTSHQNGIDTTSTASNAAAASTTTPQTEGSPTGQNPVLVSHDFVENKMLYFFNTHILVLLECPPH